MKVGRALRFFFFKSNQALRFFFREMVVNQLLIFCHENLDGIIFSISEIVLPLKLFSQIKSGPPFFFREMVVLAKINFGHAFSSKMCLLLKGTPF